MITEKEREETEMTFTVIECVGNESTRYTLDIETLDELASFADRFGHKSVLVNFEEMTIMVYLPTEW
jgi:Holliday junction resolvase